MAWHDDRNRIRPDGLTDRPGLVRLPDLAGELTVRRDVPVRHPAERVVDLLLEVGPDAREVELQVEVLPLLREVLLQLNDCRAKVRRPRLGRIGVPLLRECPELDAADAGRRRPDGDGPGAGARQMGRVNLDRVQCVASPALFFNAS